MADAVNSILAPSDRRKFLKGATCAAAALATIGTVRAAPTTFDPHSYIADLNAAGVGSGSV